MANTQRAVYQGAHRQTLEDPDNSVVDPNLDADGNPKTSDNSEDLGWRKRYGDARTHINSLTERVKELESQNRQLSQKEVKLPSSVEEINAFAQKYPDIYRHIRSIAMNELLQERENLASATEEAKEKLEKMERELGYKKVLTAHPDFEELTTTSEFQEWANVQPSQIQEWLFESTDPELCIKAVDLYKAEAGFKKKVAQKKSKGADEAIRSRTPIETPDMDNKRIWKMSDIEHLHPKLYEKYEQEIELARQEGRIDHNS